MKMQHIEKLIVEISDLIDYDYDNSQTWSWSIMSNWELGGTKGLKNGITITKILDEKDHLRFFCKLPPMTSFDMHWHDCSEVCTILSGQMTDLHNGRTWNINEKAVFNKGQKHTPYNPLNVDCFILVDFYK